MYTIKLFLVDLKKKLLSLLLILLRKTTFIIYVMTIINIVYLRSICIDKNAIDIKFYCVLS